MISIPFILSYILDYFFFDNLIPHCLISLNLHIICGVYFFYHVLKLGQEVDPSRVLSHGLSRITEVTRVNWIFLLCRK